MNDEAKSGNVSQKWTSPVVGPYEVIDRPGEITYQTRHYSDHKDIRTIILMIWRDTTPALLFPLMSRKKTYLQQVMIIVLMTMKLKLGKLTRTEWEHGGGIDKEYVIPCSFKRTT